MVFSSMFFIWVFLPILLLVYFLFSKHLKIQNAILLLFSLLFYSWGEPKNIIYMIITILINYFLALLLSQSKVKWKRRVFLTLAIFFDLGLLGYFKYSTFLATNINHLFQSEILPLKEIVLPIGISFYTFQILSYVIDLYWEKIELQKNIVQLTLYISFFPQLIAGPIVRYSSIEKQLAKRKVDIEKFTIGIKRFIYGLAKKVLIANTMASYVDNVYSLGFDNVSTIVSWLVAICYMLQIYYDFSGYSDMAIGLGKMFGFDFSENFNYPYLSTSITEFWRRWHISLSTWFKEYLYIPLGGNKKGKIRTYLNLWIVFFTTGLWHGASWNFIIWGLYHGLFMFIERLFFKKIIDKHKMIGFFYTGFVVIIGWVFFRAPSLKSAMNVLARMFTLNTTSVIKISMTTDFKFYFILGLAILLSGIIQKFWSSKIENSKVKVILEPILILGLFALSIMNLVSNTYNPFIYFRF